MSQRLFNMQGFDNLLQLGITTKPSNLGPDLPFKIVHDSKCVLKGFSVIAEVRDSVLFQGRCRRALLQDVCSIYEAGHALSTEHMVQ